MAADGRTWWDTRGWFGVPRWGWAGGLAAGTAVGLTMFRDNVIVGMLFGLSIGTAFAMAFARNDKGGPGDPAP